MRRSLVPALVAALVMTMSVTACGADEKEPGVASLNGGGDDSDGGDGGDGEDAASDEGLEEQALEFAQCMRENGVPDFPDPDFEDGRMRMQIGGPGDGPLDEDALEGAMKACEDLRPQGGGNFSEEDRQEMQDAALAHAECMRENGVPDFPDPDFSDNGARIDLDGIDPESPAFTEAHEACEDKLPGRLGGDDE